MESEPLQVFPMTSQLSRLVFEGRQVDQVRITITSIPLKVVARRDSVRYAEQQDKPLSAADLLELRTNATRAVEIFNTVLQGSPRPDAVFDNTPFVRLKLLELNPFYCVLGHFVGHGLPG